MNCVLFIQYITVNLAKFFENILQCELMIIFFAYKGMIVHVILFLFTKLYRNNMKNY